MSPWKATVRALTSKTSLLYIVWGCKSENDFAFHFSLEFQDLGCTSVCTTFKDGKKKKPTFNCSACRAECFVNSISFLLTSPFGLKETRCSVYFTVSIWLSASCHWDFRVNRKTVFKTASQCACANARLSRIARFVFQLPSSHSHPNSSL